MTRLKNGKYELCEKIGDGGFGQVFRGVFNHNGKKVDVAIKVCPLLKDSRNRPDPRLEARILKELSQVSDAKHVIAEYYDAFTESDSFYLVMERCKHGSVYDYLTRERKKPFTEEQSKSRDMLLSILNALEIIHTAGYVHRDLSPKNILIYSFSNDSVPQIKLVDFGLSKKMSLIKGTVAGTPGFFNAEMMREGYSMDVDFYALGCVMFFMLTGQLISSKIKKFSREEVKECLAMRGPDAIELVMQLTNEKNRITDSNVVKFHSFFTSDYMKAARMQASSIHRSASNAERSPFRDLSNRAVVRREREKDYTSRYRFSSAPHAQSLPIKFVARQQSKLSVATSASPVSWPFPPEFKPIVKNVMVNKFGRVLLRGPDRLFICETLNFKDNHKCTYVGHLINACSSKQELRIYQPISRFLLPDFGTYINGIPETELKLIDQIKRPADLDRKDSAAARTMYSKMCSVLKAVCEMVRKREENPTDLVDTLAKITWGGLISVELSNKQTIRWPCRANGPPLLDYPNLTQAECEMLEYVHADFSQVFVSRSNH